MWIHSIWIDRYKDTPPPPARIRCALRLVSWNVLLTIGGLSLMAVAGDVYLRLTRPFAWSVLPSQFVPGIGIIRKPNAEVRYTNGVDFWTVSRTNSLGFLDREPPSHERAVESCSIAISAILSSKRVRCPLPTNSRFDSRNSRPERSLNRTSPRQRLGYVKLVRSPNCRGMMNLCGLYTLILSCSFSLPTISVTTRGRQNISGDVMSRSKEARTEP